MSLMNKRLPVPVLVSLLLLPSALAAQGFAVGGRAGTLGFGAEAALGLSDNLALRGGIGSFFFEFKGEADDIEYTVSPPSLLGTVGIDFYPTGGSFRLMGGLLIRDGDFNIDSEDVAAAGGVEIGDTEYTESGTLHGALSNSSAAPFVGLGFGNHAHGGFGFFIDFGLAFVGETDVTLEARGPLAQAEGIQQELDREARNVEDEAGDYLKYWPILNLGFKIPIG
jgi:hypothetical protein